MKKRLRSILVVLGLVVLAGCAGPRIIDSAVVATVDTPAGYPWAGATYRFERLPSQRDQPETMLAEEQAEQALAAVGLTRLPDSSSRVEPQPQLSVLLGFQGFRYLPSGPWGRPYYGDLDVYGSVGLGAPWGSGWGMGLGLNLPPPPRYRREVSLVLRDTRSGRIVYETRAAHDGPWHDSANVFAALFKAALVGFPTPPSGVRHVEIEIPR